MRRSLALAGCVLLMAARNPCAKHASGSSGGTNNNNNGSCGAAHCVTDVAVVGKGGKSIFLNVNSTSLFWLTGKDLVTVPKGGGDASTMTTGLDPYGLCATETTLYWADQANILSMPSAGGDITTVATQQQGANQVVCDDASAYWKTHGTVSTIPPGGGAVITLAQNDTSYIQVRGDNVWFLQVDGGLYSIPKAGGAPMLAMTLPEASEFMVSDTDIYWAGLGDLLAHKPGLIVRQPLDGSAAITIDGNGTEDEFLRWDGVDNLYWSSRFTGTIYKSKIDGSQVETLVEQTGSATGMTLDADSLYWINGGQLKLRAATPR
jgi:hypothetical protein